MHIHFNRKLNKNTPISTPNLILHISTFLPKFYYANSMCIYRL